MGVDVMRGQVVHGHLGLCEAREGAELEAVMPDDASTDFTRKAVCAAEVVGVGVRDDDAVHILGLESGLGKALHDHLPCRGTRQPRVHQGGPLLVENRVAIDVAKPR